MILGINLGNHAFISADTRASFKDKNKLPADDIQKIVILPKDKLVIAAAGKAIVAAEIVNSINNGIVDFPITVLSLEKEFQTIINNFLAKYDAGLMQGKVMPNNPFGDVVMLFQQFNGIAFNYRAICITFDINATITPIFKEYEIKKGKFILFGSRKKFLIEDLPYDSFKYVEEESTAYDKYLLATDMIIKTGNQMARDIVGNNLPYKSNPIGGLTITLHTIASEGNKLNYEGISGYRSIDDIMGKDVIDKQYCVPVITNFDPTKGLFYQSDMKKRGMLISNIVYKGIGIEPMFRYDSGGGRSNNSDSYYIEFHKYDLQNNMDLEL